MVVIAIAQYIVLDTVGLMFYGTSFGEPPMPLPRRQVQSIYMANSIYTYNNSSKWMRRLRWKFQLLSLEKHFDNTIPYYTIQHHLWALYHEESPFNNWKLSYHNAISLFNFTSTYADGSNFPIPTQWSPPIKVCMHVCMFSMIASPTYSQCEMAYRLIILTMWQRLIGRKAVDVKKKSKNGKALAVYVQSNCNVPSDRTRYVKELMKYIGRL